MVFGLILGAASIPIAAGGIGVPTVTGVGKGVGSASGDAHRDEEMGKNCRLKVFCAAGTRDARRLHGRYVGLADGYVGVKTADAGVMMEFTGMFRLVYLRMCLVGLLGVGWSGVEDIVLGDGMA